MSKFHNGRTDRGSGHTDTSRHSRPLCGTRRTIEEYTNHVRPWLSVNNSHFTSNTILSQGRIVREFDGRRFPWNTFPLVQGPRHYSVQSGVTIHLPDCQGPRSEDPWPHQTSSERLLEWKERFTSTNTSPSGSPVLTSVSSSRLGGSVSWPRAGKKPVWQNCWLKPGWGQTPHVEYQILCRTSVPHHLRVSRTPPVGPILTSTFINVLYNRSDHPHTPYPKGPSLLTYKSPDLLSLFNCLFLSLSVCDHESPLRYVDKKSTVRG